MTLAEAQNLEFAMEHSRHDSVTEVRRRAWSMLRWWASVDFAGDKFYTVFGFLAGACMRQAYGSSFVYLFRLVRAIANRIAGAHNPLWLDASMVAWFVSGHRAFSYLLFDACMENSEGAAPDRIKRIERAQFICSSARLNHPDFDMELRFMEVEAGRAIVPAAAAASAAFRAGK